MTDIFCRIGGTALVLAAALAGCAAPPETAPTIAVPAVTYDGRYSGTVLLTGVASGADRSWCETSPQFVVDVVGNAFTYSQPHPKMPNGGIATYSVAIARDGTFQGQSNATGLMSGRIEGGAMSATVDGIGCAYKVTATRR
jgi:hypothetical protein